MKILMVSSFLPYPLTSGGHIRLFNLINELSVKHEITLVCEKRDYQTEYDVSFLEKICKKVIVVKRKRQWSLGNIFKTGFSLYPFLMIGHTDSVMKSKIKELLNKEKFDVIHIETFYVMQNLPPVTVPVVLAEHNIEYLVYDRFRNLTLKPVQFLLYLDILKMKYWEKKMWQKATKLIAVSQPEKKLMTRDAYVVPNGVNLKQFKVQSSKFKVEMEEKRMLFIGDFKWVQNRDAVEWLLKEIWPKINSKFKIQSSKLELKLWIVGREIPNSIKKINDKNIIFDENIPGTAEIFKKAYLLLFPTRVGGGTSFKILEAMASGVPVITTSLGIEGIDAENEKEVLIANSSDGIAEKIIEVLKSDNLYRNIAKNARQLIEEKYDWKIIVKKLEEVYLSAVQK